MRCLLFVMLILSRSGNFFAQDKERYNHGDIFHTKWYLNFAQINYFGWNDSSELYTSVPVSNYLVLGEKLAFGPKPEYGAPFPDYFYNYQSVSDDGYGVLCLYEKKRDCKKRRNEKYSYNVYMNPYELVLLGNNPGPLQFNDLSSEQTLVFSRNQDLRQLYGKLMGNWSTETRINSDENSSTDTLVLLRSSSSGDSDHNCNYQFQRIDGQLYCIGNCSISSSNNGNSGYAPDPYYLFYDQPVYFDLAKHQLIFRGESGKTYDIIELTENEMKLVLHEEYGIMGPPK